MRLLFLIGALFSLLIDAMAQRSDEATVATFDSLQFKRLLDQGKARVYDYPDSALFFLREALVLSAGVEGNDLIADAMGSAGAAYYVKGEFDKALPYFTEARRIYSVTGNHAGLASSFNRVGLILATQGRYRDAIALHRKGVHHGRLSGDLRHEARNNFNIALAYDEMMLYDSALQHLQTSWEQSAATNLTPMMVMTLNRLGKVRYHQGQYDDARMLYDSALSFPEGQNNWERCFSLAGLAEVDEAQGYYDRAISRARQSLEQAFLINAKWEVVHVTGILSRAYANKGDFQNAYSVAMTMQAYKDSVFNEEKERNLNYIYLKENELATATLERENAVQAAELESRNFQLWLVLILSVSLGFVTVVLYSRHRQRNNMNRRLVRVNEQIERQNRELNELNQAKNQLFSIISHDLRTPFANLHGLLTLIRSGALDANERDEILKHVEDNVASVSATLESLLQWAQNQMEGRMAEPEAVFVDDTVRKVITLWKPAMDRKGIQCVFNACGAVALVNQSHLQTVIRNIIGNAVKFTRPRGSIVIDTTHDDQQVGIIIRDTGIGMPPAVLDSLFRFEKTKQRNGTANEKGTGLGLIICLQLLEKNDGRIEVTSEEGKGTTFRLWVPLLKASAETLMNV